MDVMEISLEREKLPHFDDVTTRKYGPLQSVAKERNVLDGPLAWKGADFANHQSYVWQLTQLDVEEIEAALESFKTLGLDGDEVARHNFPLPNLKQRLDQCAAVIHQGQGFFVLAGLDPTRYTVEDSVTIYLGIASYIADIRGLQDRKGNVLSHVTNSKLWTVPVDQRHGIHSSTALPFHNDMGCDILALQVRHSAQQGGHTYLSSAWTVFNELLVEEPEVVETLITPNWPVQVSGRKARYYLAPAFTIHNGKLMASADPSRFGPHPSSRNTNIPPLTGLQEYALKRVSVAAQRSELRLSLQTGDFVFVNNWALLHRRDSYRDDGGGTRHLVRLWLRNTQLGWAVPTSMLPPWLAAYGVSKRTPTRLYPIIPMPNYVTPKYSAGSAAFVIEDSDSDSDSGSGSGSDNETAELGGE